MLNSDVVPGPVVGTIQSSESNRHKASPLFSLYSSISRKRWDVQSQVINNVNYIVGRMLVSIKKIKESREGERECLLRWRWS